jgi:type IV pilus assembly protein PilP
MPLKILIPAGLLALLTACGEAPAPTPQPPAGAPKGTEASPARAGKSVAPAAQPQPEAVTPLTDKERELEAAYRYDPAGRRDPFFSLILMERLQEAKAEQLPPLQRYPVEQFRVQGIAWERTGHVAMLHAPDGRGYMVRQGNIVGRNKGVVKQITPKTVVVEERLKSLRGELQTKVTTLELRKKEEAGKR